jgi:dsRNA-specific ribonuclease/ERCC4-related helicase
MVVLNLAPNFEELFGGIGLDKQAKSNSEIKGSGAKPINIMLQEKITLRSPPITPRHYQVELCKSALEHNAIIYLGTGLGKTFIVVMLLRAPEIAEQIGLGRRAVFLAPTQDLVKQQAEYMHRQLPYKVKVYCGRTCNTGGHIDNWNREIWQAELDQYELLCMTPAILRQALAINALSWKDISVLIFDEAHHAATSKKERSGKKMGSEYSQILKHYKHMQDSSSQHPKFLGLTASLINDMPKGADCIKDQVLDLERKLLGPCVTDLSAIESKAKHVIWKYNSPDVSESNDTIYNLFHEYAKRYEDALQDAKAKKMLILGPKNEDEKKVLAYHNRLRLAASGFSIKPSSFPKVLKQMAAIRKNSGIWTLANICYNLTRAMEKHSKVSFISDAIRPVYIEFGNILKLLLKAIYDLVGSDYKNVLLNYAQPKLLCLLDVLKKEYSRVLSKTGHKETFSCIVFVKSRVEVVAICNWLIMVSRHIEGYDFIKANYAIGLSATMASKWACITRRKSTEQSMMLDDFRRGRLNVIVTTSVLEEGIDLPVCSTVIRYDTPDTFRVYVQSRGRARQQESTFVLLADTTKKEEIKDALIKFNDFEERVKEVIKCKDQSQPLDVARAVKDNCGGDNLGYHDDYFEDKEKGIFINSSTAKTVLHMYCAKLARRCAYTNGFQCKREEVGDCLRTTLFFPPGCPVKDSVTGKARRTAQLADSSAIIAAYEALYKNGELDSHGVPLRATEEHIDQLLDRHGMKPDLTQLNEQLEGEITKDGNKIYHTYPWKLCYSKASLCEGFNEKLYKLYSVTFTAVADDKVRQDTRCYFETTTYGLIIDASSDCLNLPQKLYSHYGEFKVNYALIDDNFKISRHEDHNSLINFTFRLIRTFWILKDFNKLSFSERCLFYLVPLNDSNNIDWSKVDHAFNILKTDIRPGDIVKISRYHSTRDDFSKRFLVKEIRHDLNARSMIPGCNETFLDRIERQERRVGDIRQPVIAVWPISREFGKTSKGKKVRGGTAHLHFYLFECLERIACHPHEAYQSYNLPEIVYQIYVNALASDFELNFKRMTKEMRNDSIVRPAEQVESHELRRDVNVSDESRQEISNASDEDEGENRVPTVRNETSANSSSESSEDSDSEIYSSSYSDGSYSDDSRDSDSDSDEPASAERYRDILAQQEFNFRQRDKSDLEKWDLSEYKVPDLKHQTIHYEDSFHYPPSVDRSVNGSSILALPAATMEHQLKIETILMKFQKGIVGDTDLPFEDQVYNRPGGQVDLSIKPPITLDSRTKSATVPLKPKLLEALTLRRMGGDVNLEALENIGDSYFKYCISVVLFKYIDRNEGLLTSARSRLIGNKHFYHLAKRKALGHYAIMNKFDPEILSAVFGSKIVKNRLRMKDMADVVESLVGACLIHGGEYEAIMFMKWIGLDYLFRNDTFHEFHEYAVVFSRHPTALYQSDRPESIENLRLCKEQVKKFQEIIKYDFNDLSYLVQAFTHASAFTRCTDSYERLEFLGDAILDYLVTRTLYDAGFTKDPGQLTSSRSALVNNCTFAKLAIKYKFDVYIQHANQQFFDDLNRANESAQDDPELKFLDIVDFDRITKTLADVFEAVAGAIYLDSGCSLDTVYKSYYPMMKKYIDAEIQNPTKNVKSQLYELFPGKDRIKFEYFKTAGDDDDCVVSAKCTIHGWDKEFFGEGLTKKQAILRAVDELMNNLPSPEEKARMDQEWTALTAKRAPTRGHQHGSRGRGQHGPQRGRPRRRF